MPTIYEIRARNLRQYIQTTGFSNANVAKKLNLKSGSTLSQLLSVPPNRTLSEKTARAWEGMLNLAPGWFDIERDDFGRDIKGIGRITTENVFGEKTSAPEPVAEKSPPPVADAKPVFNVDVDVVSRIAGYVVEAAKKHNLGTLPSSKISSIIALALRHPSKSDSEMQEYVSQLVQLTN